MLYHHYSLTFAFQTCPRNMNGTVTKNPDRNAKMDFKYRQFNLLIGPTRITTKYSATPLNDSSINQAAFSAIALTLVIAK